MGICAGGGAHRASAHCRHHCRRAAARQPNRRPDQPGRGAPSARAALAAQSAHIDTISGLAIATSGTAERGLHVVDPHSGAPAVDIASLTVIEPDLATADALATAGVAMGRRARDWLESVPGHVALAIMADGRTWRTGRLRTDDAKVIEAHPVR
ncbi:MAG TPA: FAD:protein FMN transferase [Jatrophihabitantaceae bacterium]|nr:FAD:protein FMN transferase [Jatrophihabitantaceae bacterium]